MFSQDQSAGVNGPMKKKALITARVFAPWLGGMDFQRPNYFRGAVSRENGETQIRYSHRR
jgi:hypothetical protein